MYILASQIGPQQNTAEKLHSEEHPVQSIQDTCMAVINFIDMVLAQSTHVCHERGGMVFFLCMSKYPNSNFSFVVWG